MVRPLAELPTAVLHPGVVRDAEPAVVPRADPRLALRTLQTPRPPIGRGIFVLDASDIAPARCSGGGCFGGSGRSWAGWHHHCAMVTLAHAFLTLERLDPKAPRPD